MIRRVHTRGGASRGGCDSRTSTQSRTQSLQIATPLGPPITRRPSGRSSCVASQNEHCMRGQRTRHGDLVNLKPSHSPRTRLLPQTDTLCRVRIWQPTITARALALLLGGTAIVVASVSGGSGDDRAEAAIEIPGSSADAPSARLDARLDARRTLPATDLTQPAPPVCVDVRVIPIPPAQEGGPVVPIPPSQEGRAILIPPACTGDDGAPTTPPVVRSPSDR
jgi:hypothetical protein